MSRKHYEQVAAMFKAEIDRNVDHERFVIVRLIVHFANIAKMDNPRFDRDKFYRAAGVGHLASN